MFFIVKYNKCQVISPIVKLIKCNSLYHLYPDDVSFVEKLKLELICPLSHIVMFYIYNLRQILRKNPLVQVDFKVQ